ncbi:hypothetical protein IAR50_003087 [Cryptococcus sp. DSM 104548]
MGLLVDGTPLSWDETKRLAEHVRNHGLTQFLNVWDKTEGRIEYMVAFLDHEHNSARLSLRQSSVTLHELQEDRLDPALMEEKPVGSVKMPTFHPEFGRYMIESTPGAPFSRLTPSLLCAEAYMRFRRQVTTYNALLFCQAT